MQNRYFWRRMWFTRLRLPDRWLTAVNSVHFYGHLTLQFPGQKAIPSRAGIVMVFIRNTLTESGFGSTYAKMLNNYLATKLKYWTCYLGLYIFNILKIYITNLLYIGVGTAQGKQGIWFLLFPDRENTGNFVVTQGKFLRHRENIFGCLHWCKKHVFLHICSKKNFLALA